MTERLTDEALERVIGMARRYLAYFPCYRSTQSNDDIAIALELLAHRRATPADDLRAAVHTALEGELSHGAYDCTRVWEAWSVGTMTQDDFVPVSERLDEITDAVVAAFSQNGGAA